MEALGPWTAGIVNAVPPTSIRATSGRRGEPAGLLDAVNVDIDRVGSVTRRTAWAVSDATPAHSLFEHAGQTYGVVGGVLGRISGGFAAIRAVTGRLAWCVLNGEPVYASADEVRVVRGLVAESLPTGTTDDDAELVLAPLPGGSAIAYWQGRLVVARGNSVLFSEPLRFGLYSPFSGFVQFEERVTWLAPLAGGVFVGLRNSVRFLAGTDPSDLRQLRVAGPSWRGGGAAVPVDGMDPDISQGATEVALWLTERGFAVGLPSGQVLYPQADRLKDLPLGAGRLVVLGDRITVLSN